jgi:CubicO group peptidase (beta-lactamase class C family)
MQLVEQGRVKLEDDMKELVPQLATMQILKGFDGDKPILEENAKPITLW